MSSNVSGMESVINLPRRSGARNRKCMTSFTWLLVGNKLPCLHPFCFFCLSYLRSVFQATLWQPAIQFYCWVWYDSWTLLFFPYALNPWFMVAILSWHLICSLSGQKAPRFLLPRTFGCLDLGDQIGESGSAISNNDMVISMQLRLHWIDPWYRKGICQAPHVQVMSIKNLYTTDQTGKDSLRVSHRGIMG